MPRTKGSVVKKKPQLKTSEGYCRVCNKILSRDKFYEATNLMIDVNGLMSVCKDHCAEIYDKYFSLYNNLEDALRATCESLDVCYNNEALRQTKSHIESMIEKGKKADRVFGYYKSKLMSTGKNNDGIDAFRYKDSDIVRNVDVNINNIDVESEDLNNYDLIKFWGKGFSIDEYNYLQDFFDDFVNNYECDSPTQILLFKNAAKTQLNADKALSEGNVTLYNNLMKTLSTILGDSNIKPVQETGANATEQATFGTLLKKWENEEPIPEPLPSWMSEDWIKKYILIWFFGHICKILNIQNDYSKIYEEELAKNTVEMPSETEDGD